MRNVLYELQPNAVGVHTVSEWLILDNKNELAILHLSHDGLLTGSDLLPTWLKPEFT